MASPENEKSKTGSDQQLRASIDAVSAEATRGRMSDKLDLRVSLDSVPSILANAVENLAKPPRPESKMRVFLKELLPTLTPVATVAISIAALWYTSLEKERAFNATQMAADAARRNTLAEIIVEFGQTVPGPTDHPDPALAAKREVSAMRFAAYGAQALPAVRMSLGASYVGLRDGGEQIAEQMYRAETVERKVLMNEVLDDYDNQALRQGVLEWLSKMDTQLSPEDSGLAFDKVKQTFGTREYCAKQDETVALEAAKVLNMWSLETSKDLLIGMVKSCIDAKKPDKFNDARTQVLGTLAQIAKSWPEDRRYIVDGLRSLDTGVPEPIKGQIQEVLGKI
jgi:hypothetical protein